MDSNGLFRRAGDTANIWNNSVAQEGTTMDNLIQLANTLGGTTPPSSTSPVSQYITETSTVAGVEKERTAPIPTGFVVSQVEGEKTIAGGLVIYEGTDPVVGEKDSDAHKTAMTGRNQYVWIPVDNINDMVMCSVCKGTSRKLVYDDATKTLACTNTHDADANPKLVGKLYTTFVANGETSSSGVYTRHQDFEYEGQEYSDTYTGYREPAAVTGDAENFLTHLEDEFENMAKSVAKYKGFYISRYELGVGGTSFKGQTVFKNDSTANNWYGMYNTIEGLNTEGASTKVQMIWGSQYDQVMKYLEEDETNEPYKGHKDRGITSDQKKSGETPYDEMSNIFDLEGNYCEWTAEAYDPNRRVNRGGSYYYVGLGLIYPAARRYYYGSPALTDGYCSSRLALMVSL